MKKLIVDEVAQFRLEVRGQTRGDSGAKRQDTYVTFLPGVMALLIR